MKYLKENSAAGLIMLFSLVFLLSELVNIKPLGLYSRMLIFPFLTLYFFTKKEQKNLFFGLFLVFFTIAEILLFMVLGYGLHRVFGFNFINMGTSFCVLAYSSLFVFIISKMNLKKLFKKIQMHVIVLFMFGVYLLYVLDHMIKHNGLASMSVLEYVLATTYNLSIIVILLISLLNYLYNATKKSLFIFCLCVVFSELVQTAYFFMAREVLLDLVYTGLLSLGFCFICVYMFIKVNDNRTNFLDKDAKSLNMSSTSELN